MPSSPSYTIKIHHWSQCGSCCHQCLLSMETIALFQQSVTHSTALQPQKSGRDTQRSPADRTKTYCALRRSSEEWATYWFHPRWFVHLGKSPLVFKDNSPASEVRFLWLSGVINGNCCRALHVMSLLIYINRVFDIIMLHWFRKCTFIKINMCGDKDLSSFFKQIPSLTIINGNKKDIVR